MIIREQIKAGFQGLFDHPFRTLLTMLGVIFGTAAVIAMVSIGAGARQEALDELSRFGLNSMRVTSIRLPPETLRDAIKKQSRGLTPDDAAALPALCPFIEGVAPEKTSEEKMYTLGKKPTCSVVGVSSEFFRVAKLELSRGRTFGPSEDTAGSNIAVLGAGAASETFGSNDPVGGVLQIGRARYRIIGVLKDGAKRSGKIAIKSRDYDRDVYVPLQTAIDRFFKSGDDRDLYHEVSGLWITIREGVDILAARDVVTRVLERRHRGIRDFEVLVPLELLQQSQKTQELFNLVMALIAGISLLVGGIGIMNIMLASVTERTVEIGLRRAIGASQADIVLQFLTESAVISVTGGLLGIILGIGLSHGIAIATGWVTVISPEAVLIAFTVSLTVGIVFGLFPAVKAARLDPVEALRRE